MIKSSRAFALFFITLFLASVAVPVAFNGNPIMNVSLVESPYIPSSTNYVVSVRVFNELQAFNDDDFQFRVLNGSVPLSNAWVRLFNATDKTLEADGHTDGNGYTTFYNLPVGTYKWNVSHIADVLTPDKTGQIVSNGPEASVTILFGNIDWNNDDDDLNATVRDIEGALANNLNFSIHYSGNDSIYDQVEVVSGRADFSDIPDGSYIWRLSVLGGSYAGYLLDWGLLQANGTQLLVYQEIGPLIGDPYLYDLEVFTYYETSLQPIVGAVIELMHKNGTTIDTKTTPSNGTVVFVDLPIAQVNWTVTFGGFPIGLGNYYYDLTTEASDIRAPVITSPGNQSILNHAENVTITWHVEDEFPGQIKVYVDGILNRSVSWVNSSYDYTYNVSAAFHEFIIGFYDIILRAYDQNSNFAEDIISLRIFENVTPLIDGPDPIEFYYTLTGKSLTWNVTDDFVNEYRITDNDTEVASGTISPEEPIITISLNGLDIGVHNFTLYANDTSGNTAANSVFVTVLADDITPIIVLSPSDFAYAQGDAVPIKRWMATDDFKDYYTVSLDGDVVVEDDWITENIAFDFSGFIEGTHTVTLKVYDIGGNYAESTVTVIVTQSTSFRYILYGSLVALGAIALIAVVWFIRYR
ncbi:MAG: hypothetical protein C4K48_00420 [Candidatus Thorarchaeota archaeon]|nr:MAG: hypothetical protein C4K48_00420 [Candidatus Thorarchaeota archaeon]